MVQNPQNNPVNINENLFFNIFIQRLSVAYLFFCILRKFKRACNQTQFSYCPLLRVKEVTVLLFNTFLAHG